MYSSNLMTPLRSRLALALSVLIISALSIAPARAQLNLGPLQVNGSVGASARGYLASGIANRRAPGAAEVFANVSFNLWGLSSGFGLNYSTEDTRLRQRVNRAGFNTSWGWGRASAGDVSPSYSPYSLRGVTLRGASLEFTPGNFNFAFAGGSARRPVEFRPQEGFRAASFRRMLYAGRVGYGLESQTHFHLVTVYARDLQSSLENPGEARPQENLSLAPDIGLSLFDGRLYIGTQVTVSALTPDLRNDALTSLDLPGFLTSFFTPRVGTFVSFAGDANAQLRLPRFNLSTAYTRIRPGFKSLGIGRVRSDMEQVRVEPSVSLFDRRVQLGISFAQSRNNLQSQLISTLTNRQMRASLRGRISQNFSVSTQYMRLVNANDPLPEARDPLALHQRHVAQTFMVAPMLNFPLGEYLHTISLSGSYQMSRDRSRAVLDGLRPGATSDNTTATLSYALRFPSGFAVNSSGNLLYGNASGSEIMVLGLNVGTGFQLLDDKLGLNFNGGWSHNSTQFQVQDALTIRRAMQFTLSAGGSYRFSTRDSFRMQLTGLANSQQSGAGSSFRELRATARYQHRF